MCPTVLPRSEIVPSVHLHREELTSLQRILAGEGRFDLQCDGIAYGSVAECAREHQQFATLHMSLTPRSGKHRTLIVSLDSVRHCADVVWADDNRDAEVVAMKILRQLQQPVVCKRNAPADLAAATYLTLWGLFALNVVNLFLPLSPYFILAPIVISLAYVTMHQLGLNRSPGPGISLSPRARCGSSRWSVRSFALKVGVAVVANVLSAVLPKILHLT